MTRRSKREIEDAVDRLKGVFGSEPEFTPEELTDEDHERLEELFRDLEDLDADERKHYENIQEWLDEEDREDLDVGPHEATPAEKALLDLLTAPPDGSYHFPEQYHRRFPDAPAVAEELDNYC